MSTTGEIWRKGLLMKSLCDEVETWVILKWKPIASGSARKCPPVLNSKKIGDERESLADESATYAVHVLYDRQVAVIFPFLLTLLQCLRLTSLTIFVYRVSLGGHLDESWMPIMESSMMERSHCRCNVLATRIILIRLLQLLMRGLGLKV